MINENGMKILIFHPTIAPYRLHFFNELHKKMKVKICLYYPNLKSQTFDYSQISSKFEFEPDYFDKSIKIGNRTIYLGHRQRIHKFNPDIVIVGEYGEGLWSAVLTRLICRKRYKIVTICDDSLKIAEECTGIRKTARNFGVKFIDGIILCNDKVENWYNKNFRIKTFSFPIVQEEGEFRENEQQIVDMARKYIADYGLVGKKVFLYVGRMAPEKNVEYLVHSFIESHEMYPDNVLVLIGGASEKNPEVLVNVQKMIGDVEGEDYILYVGRKEGIELKAWYFVGQVLVLPSIYDCFGAVVNEALLAGEYVMVSENAGAICLLNNENGEILDISQPLIDFSKIASKVKPIGQIWIPSKSKMPFLFMDKMKLLIEWIRAL